MIQSQMLQNYCTLFNSAYLSRGLALYHSLVKTAAHFHLYVFAFDDPTEQILTTLQLPHMTVIALKRFETPALLAVKQQRTLGEYCWTCTSSTILYCLEKFNLPSVCYCDADIYFWRDPAELLTEVPSVLLTLHRYTPKYDRSYDAGKYCVQFMWFKNDERGLKALKWWRDACIDWCYDRMEPGRFGDQKYLDDWTERFEGIKVLEHLGGGVAPWNVQQYQLMAPRAEQPILKEKATGIQFNLVFYHFHGLRFVNNEINLGNYHLSNTIIQNVYKPYVEALYEAENALKQSSVVTNGAKSVNLHGRVTRPNTLSGHLRRFKQRLLGQYHCLPANDG